MNARLLGCLLFATAVTASAHRLDEYLQATRIAVATNRIEVSIDLTPGVAVVSDVLAAIDTNRDAQLSESERQSYGERLLKDLRVGIDGRPVTLTLAEIAFPAIQEMKEGHGIIRVKAAASIDPLQPGAHTLTLTNSHLPKISVYLVNALVPKDRTVQIKKQTRDELQKDYQLQFRVDNVRRQSSKQFDSSEMERLFSLGEQMGAVGNRWIRSPRDDLDLKLPASSAVPEQPAS